MYSRRFLPAMLTAVLLPTLSAGTTVFERRWHWFESNVGRSVALAADGGYVVGAGTRFGSSEYGATLAWVDSLGDTVTVRHVSGLDNGAGYLCRVEDGGCVLAGTRDTLHVFARKFDAAGDSIWTYSSPTPGLVQAIVGTPDGGCLIVGRIPDSMYDMGATKLDSTGGEEWTRYYEEPGVFASHAWGAARTRDGGYILCGDAHDYMDFYTRLVRTDSAGQQIWTRLYFGAMDACLYDVRETQDGGFLAVGLELDTLTTRNALYLLRVDSTGALVGTRSFASPGAATQATAMDTARGGGYVVAGQIDWGDSARAWLVKLDAEADTTWTRALPGDGREQAADIRPTADGGYVLAGASDSAGGSVLLVKTDSLGGVMVGVAEAGPAARAHIAFSVAPNPASGVVRIEYSLPANIAANLRMYDISGRPVYSSFGLRASSLRLDLRSMPAGVYLLRLEYNRGSSTRKLVID
jgi:hypothetical protein